jgi:hypothetical protein
MNLREQFESLEAELRQSAPSIRIERTDFASGAFMLDVWWQSKLFVMACPVNGNRFGVDEITDDNPGFDMVFKNAFDTFADAAVHLKSLVFPTP